MARIQIWGGGPYHPTRAQGEWWKREFGALGHQVDYREDRSAFLPENLATTDLLVLSGMEESVVGPEAPMENWETPPPGDKYAYQPLAPEHFRAYMGYLHGGKPLLIHHSGILSFDERTELDEVYDGRWVRGQTFHPPYHRLKVKTLGQHPCLAGIGDFEIDDELYCKLLQPKRSQVLLSALWEGMEQPLAWATSFGPAKVLFSGLGHDVKSYGCPELQRFLKNGVEWLLKEPPTS
jgi:type 1 glutamine amidotransferase